MMHANPQKNINLFIYGSLREPSIFKSVCGLSFTINPSKIDDETLFAEPAFLSGYKKITPDNVYFYAVKDSTSKVEGFVVYNMPLFGMDEIDRYEGKRYYRQTVKVNTAKGLINAHAYLACPETMERHFGDRFHVNLIHELWLRKRIEEFIKKRTRPGERTQDAELERRANRELLATTERDLVISHYRADSISDYYIEHELDRPRPSIQHLYSDDRASPFIENYLALVIKQALLNQLEEKIQARYRYHLEHMLTVEKALQSMPYKNYDIIDYIKHAIRVADNFFEPRIAWFHLEQIRSSLQPGLVPLGTEIELSNLGADATSADSSSQEPKDLVYDDFRYFNDFSLDVLSWKLGGYIDDHTGSTEHKRRLGFFELAPGRLNVAGELSRPATNDPWLLNQLIREIVNFYNVKPHSLHLSFQLRKHQLGKQKILPLGFVKCLLVLGGGLKQRIRGSLWVSRMQKDELLQHQYGEELVFARTSKRRWYLGEDWIGDRIPAHTTTNVQQYKFIRLEKSANYEPLILCLKGLQLAYNPADYLTNDQLRRNKRLRQEYEELKKWADEPTQIS
ncbi:MAG: gamma-glutamylcyclotransferase family protein, partial [Planctomycetota bacterium]